MIPAAAASLKTLSAPLRRALAIALLLIVAPASLPLAAQAPQQAPAKPAEQPESQQEQAENSSVQAAETAPEESAISEATPPESEDPFDYEASEQISEDLSVSFPVDI